MQKDLNISINYFINASLGLHRYIYMCRSTQCIDFSIYAWSKMHILSKYADYCINMHVYLSFWYMHSYQMHSYIYMQIDTIICIYIYLFNICTGAKCIHTYRCRASADNIFTPIHTDATRLSYLKISLILIKIIEHSR